VRAQAPHHLAADALDPHELVDRAERVAFAVSEDALGLRRSHAGQEGEHLGRRRVQVHGAVDGLRGRARDVGRENGG